MTKCYLLDIKDMDDPAAHSEWQPFLSKKRWDSILSFAPSVINGRKQCAGAGFLLRWAFSREGITNGEAGVTFGKNGKPVHDDIFFNLSHSSEKVFCVISDKEVGCDIQKNICFKDNLLRKICTFDEYRYLDAVTDPFEKSVKTTRLWALKESVLKLTGDGILKEMSDVAFFPLAVKLKAGDDVSKPEKERSFAFGEPEVLQVYIDNRVIREKAFLFQSDGYGISVCGMEAPKVFQEVSLTTIMNEGII